jgi:hypothetical protein
MPQPAPAAYVASAAKVLTVIHVATATGHTRCGLPMTGDGVWLPVDPRPGDRICRDCQCETVTVQEALL